MNTEANRARAKCAAKHLGLWAVEPAWFAQAFAAVRAGIFPLLDEELEHRPLYEVGPDGVAVVEIVGHLIKGDSKWGGTNSVRTRQAIRKADADESVRGIILYVDSPGGTVAGTDELATAVRNTAKPVHAYIDDLGASAAYWVASQAQRIAANPTGEIGSIGTLAVAEDTSGTAAMEGVKVHVISTGPYKGAFVDGAPITGEHLEYLGARVEDADSYFQAAVKAGRGFDAAGLKAVSDGRVFGAKDAKRLGLIDGIESQEEARARLAAKVRPKGTPRRTGAAQTLRIDGMMG